MKIEGGCYCKAMRYEITAQPMFNAQCHCRQCQYYSGGNPNVMVIIPEAGFRYTKGTPKQFTRAGIEAPVTREFCGDCGTSLISRWPARMPGSVFIKLGTLDDPTAFGNPQIALFTSDQQPFHAIAPGVRAFERMPG